MIYNLLLIQLSRQASQLARASQICGIFEIFGLKNHLPDSKLTKSLRFFFRNSSYKILYKVSNLSTCQNDYKHLELAKNHFSWRHLLDAPRFLDFFVQMTLRQRFAKKLGKNSMGNNYLFVVKVFHRLYIFRLYIFHRLYICTVRRSESY